MNKEDFGKEGINKKNERKEKQAPHQKKKRRKTE